jgi:hypothetical protein
MDCRGFAKEEQMPDNAEIIIFPKFPLFLALFKGGLKSSLFRLFSRFSCFYHFFMGLSIKKTIKMINIPPQGQL